MSSGTGMRASAPSHAEIEAVLNGIIDPCSEVAGNPAGLIDMGLIRDLRIEPAEAGSVVVHGAVRVTEPGCLMGAVFLREARERLEKLPGVMRVALELSQDFDWHPLDMAGAPRARMLELRQAIRQRLPGLAIEVLARRPD